MTFSDYLAVLALAVGVAGVIIGVVLSRKHEKELTALKVERRVHTDQLHDMNDNIKALQGIIEELARNQGERPENIAARALHDLIQARSPSADSASHYTTSVGPFHPDSDIDVGAAEPDESRMARLLLGHTYVGDPERSPWLRKWRSVLPTTWEQWQAKWDREQEGDESGERVNLRSTGDDEIHE